MAGMWYDLDGKYNGVISELTEGKSKHIPMPYTKYHKKNNKKWHSSVGCIEQLFDWFALLDIKELIGKGYVFI